MEAIDLTLNQVNFEAEEHDISANQELHSFSNLVAFDSDIRGGDEDDKPVIARRFRKSKVSDQHQLRSQSSLAELAQIRGNVLEPEETTTNKKNPAILEDPLMEKSTAFEPSKDSFQAFTMTVEALALQRSVIGGSNVTPASAEEVAKAIAAAQQKIQGQVSDTSDAESSGHQFPRVTANGDPSFLSSPSMVAPFANVSPPLTLKPTCNASTVDTPTRASDHSPDGTPKLSQSTPDGISQELPEQPPEEDMLVIHNQGDEQPSVILKSGELEFEGRPKRVKFKEDVEPGDVSLVSNSDTSGPATPVAVVDESMAAGTSAKVTRNASFDSDYSFATNTEASNFGSIQGTPVRGGARKQELVPINPNDLSKVTAYSRKIGSAAIKSEDIKPAILPPEAQSLVLPEAVGEPSMKSRVEAWLFSEAYQGGKARKGKKRSSPSKKKKSRASSEESSPASSRPTPPPSSETHSSTEVDSSIPHSKTGDENDTRVAVQDPVAPNEPQQTSPPQNIPDDTVTSGPVRSDASSPTTPVPVQLPDEETSPPDPAVVAEVAVHQATHRMQSPGVKVTSQEDSNAKVVPDVSESLKLTVLNDKGSAVDPAPQSKTQNQQIKPSKPITKSDLELHVTSDVPVLTPDSVATGEPPPVPSQVPAVHVDPSPPAPHLSLHINTDRPAEVPTSPVEPSDPPMADDPPLDLPSTHLPTSPDPTVAPTDPVRPDSADLHEPAPSVDSVSGPDTSDLSQSHTEQVPLQTSTPIRPQTHNPQQKSRKEKKKTKQYFMNKAKEVEADLESDEWSTRINEAELSMPTGQRRRTSSTSSSRKSSSEKNVSQSLSALKAELNKVTRQKAKLEGHLEVVEKEAKGAINERAKLQAQVAAMRSQVQAQDHSKRQLDSQHQELKNDMSMVQDQRGRLERVILDAQKLLEEKDLELRAIQEDLTNAHGANDKLQEKVKDIQAEVVAKEANAQALKGKIAEVYVEFQTTNQAKILADGEIASLQSEIKSLTNQRDWYQDQLKTNQEAKGALQKQITDIQSESLASNTLVARLKADNLRVKQQLAETQQRALNDKEVLARHLETIEADMMEREAAFTQMRQQREAMATMMESELQQDDAATNQQIEDLNEEVRKMKNEIRRKDASIFMLNHEKSELVKRITLSQEGILERDKTIDTLEKKGVELEVQNQKLAKDFHIKSEELRKVRDLKNAIEIELSSARDEKKTFDDTLRTIKFDMSKVVKNFLQMKQDMSGKSTELETTLKHNNELKAKVEDLELQLEREKRDVIRERRESQLGSSQITTEGVTRLHTTPLVEENVQKSADIERWKQIEDENTKIKSENHKIAQELSSSKEKLLELEVQVRTLLNEKTKLAGDLENRGLPEDNGRDLEPENQRLREEIARLQSESHQEITLHKDQAVKLSKDLDNLQHDLHQRQESYEASLAEASQKIASLQEARLQLQGASHISDLGNSTGDTSNQSHDRGDDEKTDDSVDSQSNKLKVLSVEEANLKMQGEMQRAVEFIETKFNEKETKLTEELKVEREKALTAEERQKSLEEELKEMQSKMEKELAAKEKAIQDQLNEYKKKADLADETARVLKAEMDDLMLKLSDNNQGDITDVVDKLAEERQVRAEVELELRTLKAQAASQNKELEDASTETNEDDTELSTGSSKDISMEEANKKMQEEMTRAIEHIETNFKSKEANLVAQLEAERSKVEDACKARDALEQKLNTDLEELKCHYGEEKSHFKSTIQALNKKVDLSEEANAIMKEEMDKLMLKMTEHSGNEEAENNTGLAKEIGKLKQDLDAARQEKDDLEKQISDSQNSVYETKLENLIQNLLSSEEQSHLSQHLASGDQVGGREALLSKLASVADKLSSIEGGKTRLEQLSDGVHSEGSKPRQEQPDTTDGAPYLLHDVLSQMQKLESEKQDLESKIKTLIKERDESRQAFKQSSPPVHSEPVSLAKQVDIFMNRDSDSDATCASIPSAQPGDTQSPGAQPGDTISPVHSPPSNLVMGLLQPLDVPNDVKLHLQKELNVIIDNASSQHEAEMERELSELKARLASSPQHGESCDLSSESEVKEDLLQKLKLLQGEYADLLDTHQTSSEAAAKELELLRQQLHDAQHKLSQTEAAQKEMENSSSLVLDLEREKGRLAGVMKTHEALQEHTHVLEATLAQRESSVVEMSSHVQEELVRKERRCTDLAAQVEKLQTAVQEEKNSAKESKKLLLTEKGKHVKLRRQMEELWLEQDRLHADLQLKDNELAKVNAELEKTRETEITARLDTERMRAGSHGNKLEVERLRRELKDRKAKDPIIQEQVQTLEWTLSQKENEFEALRAQLQIASNQQGMERDSLQRSMQAQAAEINSLRDELTATKKERSKLQARVAELKGALENSLAQAKLMRNQRRAQKEMIEKELANPVPPLPFDLAGLEKLLQGQAVPASPDSKPLSFLQNTLSNLRGEISQLQQQVDVHVGDVQHSSEAWREIEAQVQDLRSLCQSSATSRETDGKPVLINTKDMEPNTVSMAPPR